MKIIAPLTVKPIPIVTIAPYNLCVVGITLRDHGHRSTKLFSCLMDSRCQFFQDVQRAGIELGGGRCLLEQRLQVRPVDRALGGEGPKEQRSIFIIVFSAELISSLGECSHVRRDGFVIF